MLVASLLTLPTFSVIYVDTFGVPDVSKVLAAVNPQTQKIEVYEIDGKVAEVHSPSTSWPACGKLTAAFGVPHWPFQPTHTGIDIANPDGKIGDPVRPFMPGKVIKVQPNDYGGYGKHLIIRHGKKLTSLYGHLDAISVKKGMKVKTNKVIGRMGSTGLSTGPHVHFELLIDDTPVDPQIFMAGKPGNC